MIRNQVKSFGKGLVAAPFLFAAAAFAPQAVLADGPDGPEALSALELKVQDLENQMRALRSQPMQQSVSSAPRLKRDMLFFRGGYSAMMDDRALGSFTDLHAGSWLGYPANAYPSQRENNDGWNMGVGLEHLLSDNLLGYAPDTWVMGELTIQYNQFGTKSTALAVPTVENFVGAATAPGAGFPGCVGTYGAKACSSIIGKNTLNSLLISASPKIKFAYWEASHVRPWIIPAGLDILVVSPPTDSANVLDVGVQFGAGIDYEVLPGVTLGIDGRYHMMSGMTDPSYSRLQTRMAALNGLRLNQSLGNDYVTAGGYLGFAF